MCQNVRSASSRQRTGLVFTNTLESTKLLYETSRRDRSTCVFTAESISVGRHLNHRVTQWETSYEGSLTLPSVSWGRSCIFSKGDVRPGFSLSGTAAPTLNLSLNDFFTDLHPESCIPPTVDQKRVVFRRLWAVLKVVGTTGPPDLSWTRRTSGRVSV